MLQKFKIPIIIIASFFALGLIVGVGRAIAGQDEEAKIRSRILQLQTEITRNSTEYAGISSTLSRDRAHCDMAAAKEVQLARLNGSNNAKRTEIEVLESLLSREDAEVKLGK